MSEQNYCRRMYLISEAQYKEFYDLKNNEKQHVESKNIEQPSPATSSVVNPDTASKIEESLPTGEELPTETGTGRKSGNDVKLRQIFSDFIRNDNLQKHIETRNWNYLYSKILPLMKTNADLQKSVKIVKNNNNNKNNTNNNTNNNDNDDGNDNNTQNVNPNDTSWFNDDPENAWEDDILSGLFAPSPPLPPLPSLPAAQTPTVDDASTNVFSFLESLRKKRKNSMRHENNSIGSPSGQNTPQKLKKKRRESIIASTPKTSADIPSTSADAIGTPISKTPEKYPAPPMFPKKPRKPKYVKIRVQETPEILGKKSSKNKNKSKKKDDGSSPQSGSQRNLTWTNF